MIKHTTDSVELITSAPPTDVWRLHDNGQVEYVRMQTHRRTVESEQEAFFLRIAKPGDYKYEGADLGILITPGRLMTEEFELNDRARAWTKGILSQFVSRPLQPTETVVAEDIAEVGNFKMM